MDNFFSVLTLLEMLCVNICTFHICAKKRGSVFVVVLTVGLFTVLLFGAFGLLFSNMKLLGSGIFMVCGMLYLIPLMFLYRQSIRYSITIMCSCWIYTLLIFTLSGKFADIFSQWNYRASLLVIQTALYLLTLWPFYRFVIKKFVYIIRHADQKTGKLLFWLGISWWLFAVFLNYYMLFFDIPSPALKIIEILILCTAAVNATMTYQLLYSFRRENQNALEFEHALRLDTLTGLKNRTCFLEDAQAMIDRCTPFTIFFMDLDDFKSVNDEYGHVKGDQYLKQFSNSFSASFSSFGTFYRISGDEFVFLYNRKHDHLIYKKIEHFNMRDCEGIPFKGFSVGSASYPEDAKTLNPLIMTADKRMYEQKKPQG